ncbi:MAG: FAD-dependent oxidoreductase [Kiritimatiellae bacterium]|nr:FAD-dependent oxidoreductase [Kiritimatiellia bacterium]MCO5068855.1 FAD-dependent oxidoreductase [Kiritimatiellia bacterium]
MFSSTPLNVAIIGAGPSGFFTADALLRSNRPIRIELFEKRSHPFGLARYGIAPDHPNLRRIIKAFERTAANPAVKLHLGTEVGRAVSVEDLRSRFDVVVAAYGAEDDRTLGIPGEELPGVHSSLSFACWSNGLDEYANTPFDFSAETAVIIGNGNVALDIARILARHPESLRDSDIAPAALEALLQSRVKTIHIIGRRGPAQSSFGEAELREIGELPEVNLRVDPIIAMLSATDEKEIAHFSAERARAIVGLLRQFASRPEKPDARATISFDFLRRPIGITGGERASEVSLELCKLEGEAGNQRSVPTGALQRLPCGLLFVSIGHRGRAIAGLPFDEARGATPTKNYRIVHGEHPIPGLYAVGWIEHGATGLIGHSRRDANEAAKVILADWDGGLLRPR